MRKLGCLLLAFAALSFLGAARATDLEANKKTVIAFHNAAINDKDFDKASKYLGGKYVQHKPVAADGPEGLKGFLAFLRDKVPTACSREM
jgi:predicted SnoaL-like aldol condensation-catalyzing enzyme